MKMADKHRPAILQSSHIQSTNSSGTQAENTTGIRPRKVECDQVHYVIEQGNQNGITTELSQSQNGKAQVFLVCQDTYTCGFCSHQSSHLLQFLTHKASHAIGDTLYKCELCGEVHGGNGTLEEHYNSVHRVTLSESPVIISSIDQINNSPSLASDKSGGKVNEVQVTIVQGNEGDNAEDSKAPAHSRGHGKAKAQVGTKRKVGRPPKRKSTHEVRLIHDESTRTNMDIEMEDNTGVKQVKDVFPDKVDDADESEADTDGFRLASTDKVVEGSGKQEELATAENDFLFFLLTEHVKGRTVTYERQWLQCLHCTIQTRTKNMLVKHMRDQHLQTLASSPELDQTALQTLKQKFEKPGVKVHAMLMSTYVALHCSEGKSRRQAGSKKRQRNIEKQDIPGAYPCGQCGKIFSRLRYLRKHTDTHRTSKEYICDACGKSFKSRTYLRVHRRVHQEKVFACNQCNFTSSNNASIHMHRQIHSQGSVLCDICGYAYTDRSTLAKHKRVHDPSRPYACNYPGCMWRFKTDIMCKAHIRAHYTEGKFRCLYCGYVFRHKHHLLRHESNIHGVKNDRTATITAEEEMEGEDPTEVVTTASLTSDSVNIIISSDLMGQQLDLSNCALVVANDEHGTPITYEATDISAAYEALIKTGHPGEMMEGDGEVDVSSLGTDDHVSTVLMTTEEEINF